MVRRKVLFYELRSSRPKEKDWVFNALAFTDYLATINPPDRKFFEVGEPNGMLAEKIEYDNQQYPAIRFGRCRLEGLALIEDNGILTPEHLREGESRTEATHLVFFDKNVVGVEFSRFGLSAKQLAPYLRNKIPSIMPPKGQLNIAPLYHKKRTLDALNSATIVQKAELKFATILNEGIAPHDDRDNNNPEVILQRYAEGFNGTTVSITIENVQGLNIAGIRRLFQGAFGFGPSIAKTSVRLENDSATILNFLKGGAIGDYTEMALQETSGSVHPEAAYRSIVAVYNAQRSTINDALAVYQEGEREEEPDTEA